MVPLFHSPRPALSAPLPCSPQRASGSTSDLSSDHLPGELGPDATEGVLPSRSGGSLFLLRPRLKECLPWWRRSQRSIFSSVAVYGLSLLVAKSKLEGLELQETLKIFKDRELLRPQS